MDPDLRVSDEDRDEVVELLRGHRMAGRLDADEHEERVEEACRARFGRDLEHALRELPRPGAVVAPAPPAQPVFVRRDARAGNAFALGISSVCLVVFTAGIGSFLAFPLGIIAWVMGARAARLSPEVVGLTGRNTARMGMWLGVAGTVLAVLAYTLYALVGALGLG